MGLGNGMRYDGDGMSLGLRSRLIDYLYVRLTFIFQGLAYLVEDCVPDHIVKGPSS